MAPLNADLAHRAFSNLFVQTEILPQQRAILCQRRPRTPDEQTPWMFHLLAAPGAAQPSRPHTRRTAPASSAGEERRRIPRRSTTSDRPGRPVEHGGLGARPHRGDPQHPRRCLPTSRRTVQVISGVAETREAAVALLQKYHDRHFVERAFEMAWFESQEVLRLLNVTEADAQVYGRLATSVIYANAVRRASPSVIARNQLGQSGLWRFGISGDLPIVLVRIGDVNRIDLVKQALQAHGYWRNKGLASDLVILNEDFSGYRAVLQDQIVGLINAGPEALVVDKPGGVFVRRAEELSEEDRVLFQTVARVVLTDTVETLAEQVRPTGDDRTSARPPRAVATPGSGTRSSPCRCATAPSTTAWAASPRTAANTSSTWNPVRARRPRGRTSSPARTSARSSARAGSAYTWVENAHEFRLTTFHNDPRQRQQRGGTLHPGRGDGRLLVADAVARTRTDPGMCAGTGSGTACSSTPKAGIFSEVSTYVAMDAPVKFLAVKLRNHSGRSRRLSLTGYWELVLGEWRHANLHAYPDGEGPAHRRALRAQPVLQPQRRPDRLRAGERSETHDHREPRRVHRTQRLAGRPGGDAPHAPVGQDGRGARSVRRDTDRDRAGRWAGARDRLHPRSGGRRRRSSAPGAAFRGSGRRAAGPGSGVGALEPRFWARCMSRPRTARSTCWPTAG